MLAAVGRRLRPIVPVLDITENGQLTVLSGAQLFAVMSYPKERDKAKRREFVASIEAGQVSDSLTWVQRMPKPTYVAPSLANRAVELLPAVFRAPSPQALAKRSASDARGCWIAAHVLLNLLAASIYHSDLEINIEKAQHSLAKALEVEPLQTKRPVNTPGAVAKWWKKYRSVAHLHLAARMLCPGKWDSTDPRSSRPFDRNLPDLLSLSEKVRNRVIAEGFLKEGDTWRIPDDLELAPCDHELEQIIPPLCDVTIQAVKDYRPMHARY